MSTLVAIGAAIAVLTGIGAGIGIGLATSKAVEATCSLKQRVKYSKGEPQRDTRRGNSYLRL